MDNTQRQDALPRKVSPKRCRGSNTQEFSERRSSLFRALGVTVATDTIERDPVTPVCARFVCSSCYEHLFMHTPKRLSVNAIGCLP